MLYLHCGLHRTATTSFQAVLDARRADLAAAGIVYPCRWQPGGWDRGHHGLVELLRTSPGRDAALVELRDFLAGQGDDTVLLSSEQLTPWLGEGKRAALVGLLRTAREAAPVTCVWTLRSFDRTLASLNLRQLLFGVELTTPGDYLRAIDGAFAGMRCLEAELGTQSVYVKYDHDGAHCDAILARIGVPDSLARQIVGDLRRQPRANAGLTTKEAAVALHLDAISARLGVPIERRDLVALFHSGEFRFAGDEPFEPLDIGARRALHEEALRAARSHGLLAYSEFYGDLEVGGEVSPPPEPAWLSDRDVADLAAALPAPAPIGG